MRYPEHALVVLACTLAGGVERVPDLLLDPGNQTCGVGSAWAECGGLDAEIAPVHVYTPWALTLGSVVVLSMPTVLLRSRHKRKGLEQVAWIVLQCLALAYCSLFLTDHPSLIYVLTMHACVRLLVRMPISSKLVGGALWWGLRHAAALLLLLWQVLCGVPVSIIAWRSREGLACAYLAHLAGCLVPDLALFLMDAVVKAGSCFDAGDDY